MGNECTTACNTNHFKERQIEYNLQQEDILGKAESLRSSRDTFEEVFAQEGGAGMIGNGILGNVIRKDGNNLNAQPDGSGQMNNGSYFMGNTSIGIGREFIEPSRQVANLNNLMFTYNNSQPSGYGSGNASFSKSYSRASLGETRKLVKEKRPPQELSNGAVYTGEWVGNKKEGQGIQKWPDGACYDGQWKNGRANGEGTFKHADGDVFQGTWMDDKANGYGVFTRVNGSKYCGYWKDDIQNGHGIEEWNDGSKYQGYYKDGKKHGQGTYLWADGSSYDGLWRENYIDGYGVYKWPDGRRYEGSWQSNNMHGKGKYSWKDGRFYEGEYFEDKKQGYGTYRWADGKKYEGNWLNGKQEGIGKYIYPTLEERWGMFADGKKLRWLDPSEIPRANILPSTPIIPINSNSSTFVPNAHSKYIPLAEVNPVLAQQQQQQMQLIQDQQFQQQQSQYQMKILEQQMEQYRPPAGRGDSSFLPPLKNEQIVNMNPIVQVSQEVVAAQSLANSASFPNSNMNNSNINNP